LIQGAFPEGSTIRATRDGEKLAFQRV
jgi:hypothetical protein